MKYRIQEWADGTFSVQRKKRLFWKTFWHRRTKPNGVLEGYWASRLDIGFFATPPKIQTKEQAKNIIIQDMNGNRDEELSESLVGTTTYAG